MAQLKWSTAPLIELQARLSVYDGSDDTIEAAIDERMLDLKNLLAVPGKTDESRNSLNTGKLNIDGVEYSVNAEFINESCLLADELSIDEKIAAQYLQYGTEYQAELDRQPLQCAVVLFHTRRAFVLDIVRMILENAVQVDLSTRQIFVDITKKLATKEFVTSVVKTMTDIRANLQVLQEKEISGHFLGRDQDESFVENIKFRRDHAYQEHESLTQILVLLCQLGLVSVDQMKSILEAAVMLENYDQILLHYATCIAACFDSLCVPLDEGNNTIEKEAFTNALRIQSYISEKRRRPPSKLAYFHAAIDLWWYVYFGGLCSREREIASDPASKIDYSVDIYRPALESVMKGGALEFMMVLAYDTSVGSELLTDHVEMRHRLSSRTLQPTSIHHDPYGPSPSSRPLSIEVAYNVTSNFEKKFLAVMSNLVDAVISNFADLLKELRFREEELAFGNLIMEQPEADGQSQQSDELGVVDYELERFFMFISYLYTERPDSALPFWSDAEGNLYGFIVWASQSQTPLMIATYCDMLASISTGEESALAAHTFMKDDESTAGSAISRDQMTHRISWDYISEVLAYYIMQLQNFNPEHNMFASSAISRSLIGIADKPELDNDERMVISSYLRLLEKVAMSNSIVRTELTARNLPDSLFHLLDCHTPLTGAILNTIRAFLEDATAPARHAVWKHLDAYLLHNPIVVTRAPSILAGAPGGLHHISFNDRLTILLPKYEDVLALVSMVECLTKVAAGDTINDLQFPEMLGAAYRAPSGLQPYIDFVIDNVFLSTRAAEFNPHQQLALQSVCLKFIRNCIENFNTDLVALASMQSGADVGSGGVNVEIAIKPQGLVNYLRMHPCIWVMEKLFEERIYTVLFKLAGLGIDIITEPGQYKVRAAEVVRVALQVIHRILLTEDVYLDVMERFSKADDAPAHISGGVGPRSMVGPGSSRVLMGMRNFEDAILFHLYIVTQFALYVNAEQVAIASVAIKILDIIAQAPQFLNLEYDIPAPGSYANGAIPEIAVKTTFDSVESGRRIGVNRLVSALDTVEESRRVMFGFITQLERPAVQYSGWDDVEDDSDTAISNLKLEILEFLSRNLCGASSRASAAKSELSSIDADPSMLSDVPTISHFLLGFRIRDGATAASTTSLEHNHAHGGVDSPVSLFRTVVNMLDESILSVASSGKYTRRTAAYARAAADIVYKLCAAKISSPVTLSLLRSSEFDFFRTRVAAEPLVTFTGTQWEGFTFREMLSLPNSRSYGNFDNDGAESKPEFVPADSYEDKASDTLLQFLAGRTFLLEYFAVELHSVSDPPTSVFEKYVQMLITMRGVEGGQASVDDWIAPSLFACETAKALELLDFLEIDIERLATRWNISTTSGRVQDIIGSLNQNTASGPSDVLVVSNEVNMFNDIRLSDTCCYPLPPLAAATPGSSDSLAPTDNLYDLDRVRVILELKVREQQYLGHLSEPAPEGVTQQIERIVSCCRRHNAIICLRRAQSQCLAAWCRLLRIILIDTAALATKPDRVPGRDTFILETMQVLAPKLLHYAHVWESRVAEHLASASAALVSSISPYLGLNDAAHPDTTSSDEEEEDAATDIAHTVFRVSLIAVQSPHASPSVRADLYTLINIFICNHPPRRRGKLSQLQRTIQSCANGSAASDSTSPAKENRLIERVATDTVSGEGVTRIMAMTVLRAFAAVENATGRYFVLDALVRYNLLLLLVRSIKRIDEDLDYENRVSNYEVTAFKETLVFLIELAQSRAGAAQIIQSGLFTVIQNAKFLSIDPDVGIFAYASSSATATPEAGSAWFWPASSVTGPGRNVFFELVAPTMRLLTCCVLSMGQRNLGVLRLVKDVLSKRILLVRAVLRRVVGQDISSEKVSDDEDAAVTEAGRLVVLVSTLTGVLDDDAATV
ncbi:nucleoporin Nup186/Nup192/Nup205 [Lipomyces tetrasporus]|uniref:Nucleoporin Nup186/Nup192/Nup205 n=1 Tax=Lipomyces tetrasporus TaxID=54092 RepID=A0AAD7QW57_9ASCO|nr:nucleoporin Nup186/Nup192/Nup205 [Lipomyces tetrasporus]KAJ8102331.1 nucleoporin Nup186/Nup192/Nup205 [Lipomyces tetrasporus]